MQTSIGQRTSEEVVIRHIRSTTWQSGAIMRLAFIGGEEFDFHTQLAHFMQRSKEHLQEGVIAVGEVDGVQVEIGMNTSVQRREGKGDISIQMIKAAAGGHDAEPTREDSGWIREGSNIQIE